MLTLIHRHHSVLCHLHCTTILYFGCCYYIHKLDATTTLRITMLTCKCIRFVVNVFNSLYKNKSTSWMQFGKWKRAYHLHASFNIVSLWSCMSSFLDQNDTTLKDACKCNNDNACCTHVKLG